MKIRKILELSVDLADPVKETKYALRAVLDSCQTISDQAALLRAMKEDVEALLKGVEAYEQPLPNAGRNKENK